MLIHASLPAFSALIGREYLYDMAPEHRGHYEVCMVFGVSSYAGRALTFQVLVAGAYHYSYVPISALRVGPAVGPTLEMADLVHRDCPGERIAVTTYDYLRGARVDAYLRRLDTWMRGEYVATIDWPDDNEQVHLVQLECGDFAALPNHKLVFHGGPRVLPPYRKLRREWSVGPVEVTRRMVIATRNPGKVREIREILAGHPELEIVGLDSLGIEETPEEDALEEFDSFEENALAKARHFARLTCELTLAEDSGLCVDALGGAPGVRSRRFAPGPELRGEAQDAANNAHLLRALLGASDRVATYRCAAAVVSPSGAEDVCTGACHGVILDAPRGAEGFAYDPLFWSPEAGCTFGELPPAHKNEVSHRGRALRRMAGVIHLSQPQEPQP